MSAPIIVVGHKNPDNDAISAAVGYAYLKNELARRSQDPEEASRVYRPVRLGPCRRRPPGSSRGTASPPPTSSPTCTRACPMS